MFGMEVLKNDEKVVVFLEGMIDSTTAGEFAAKMENVLQETPHTLILDFGKVDYISSAGFRILFMIAKEMKKNQGDLSAVNVSNEIQNLFNMVHMDHVMKIN